MLDIGTHGPMIGGNLLMTLTKEEVIHMMCLEYRHDFGLRKQEGATPLESGMTEKDAKILYSVMEYIYNEIIKLAPTKTLKEKPNATKKRKRKS
jgi:hypothetical protein